MIKKRILKIFTKVAYFAALIAVSGVSRMGVMQPIESKELRKKSLF